MAKPQYHKIRLTSARYMHGEACTCKTITLRTVTATELKTLWRVYSLLGFEQMEDLSHEL